jgi:RNA polymerase sigma-70 factor (ECF subfamily)
MTTQTALDHACLGDAELARRCAARERGAILHVITANNQRLFRTAWSILKSRPDAEEAVQAAYLSAFSNIGSFEGRSALSTWLTRIVVNEALGRLRSEERRRRQLEEKGVAVLEDYREALMRGSQAETPDAAVAREEVRKLLEKAVADLPDSFRTVFVMREVEGLSSEETAEILGIPLATVKTRLFRSRRRLRELLAPELSSVLSGTFPFAGGDCAALAERVLARLGL